MVNRWFVRATLGFLLLIGVATSGLAQMCGGYNQPPCPGQTTNYNKGYGSGKAIAIGAAGAAAVVVAILIIHHRHAKEVGASTLVGCTAQSNDATTLTDEYLNTTYSLTSLSKDVKSGERVELEGRKSREASGSNSFRVQKLVKDIGPCAPETANAGPSVNP